MDIPYGSETINIDLDRFNIDVILPNNPITHESGQEIVSKSLRNALGPYKIPDFAKNTIGIAINDPTRPIPHREILPNLVDFLMEHGAAAENITFFIANGTHKLVSKIQIEEYLPESIWKRFKIQNHNSDDNPNLEFLGNSRINTPIWINKNYYLKDIKIVTGNIEPHHFMGYSGGVKSAAIGLAGRETIIANHSLLTNPKTKMGIYFNNPMRQDIEEIGQTIGIDYALNVIINSKKQICACFWGDPREVAEAGVKFNRENIQLNRGVNKDKYDLVIASPGGFPKDINLYQAQKALTHACKFAKKNAPIILVSECREGHGSDGFFNLFDGVSDFRGVILKFEGMEFEIGPHKAYQLALQGIDHDIYLLSGLSREQTSHVLLHPIDDIGQAIDQIGRDSNLENILVLPYATHTIPGDAVD